MTVSVIIPAYNAEKTLAACLESILHQTRTPQEVIVVDDGSTDKTVEVASAVGGTVKVVSQEHAGAAKARNIGAAQSASAALFFCDADLVLDPKALEKLSATLESHPEAAFAYCAFRWGGKVFGMKPFDPQALRRNNYISTMSLIRREAFPGFDETLHRFQDWDLWLTMLERGKTGVSVPEVLFTVQADGSMSRRGGLSRWQATAKLRKKHGMTMRAVDLWYAVKESLIG